MARRSTKIRSSFLDVEARLAELGFGSREVILRVRDAAQAREAEGVSPFFPVNGAGTLAYQYGTRELRQELSKLKWKLDNSSGASASRHPEARRVALYQNVTVACSLTDLPQPRTRKGVGAERLSGQMRFEEMDLPTDFDESAEGCEVWLVMRDEKGAVEVTYAIVRNGGFSEFRERIFVDDGAASEGIDVLKQDNDEGPVHFAVPIKRK